MENKSSNKSNKNFIYFVTVFFIVFVVAGGILGNKIYESRKNLEKYSIIEPNSQNKPPYPVSDILGISDRVDALKRVDAIKASDLFIKETDKYFKNICTDRTCYNYKIMNPKKSQRLECSSEIKQIDIIPLYLRKNDNYISMMLYRATFADNSQLIYKTTLEGSRYEDWISLTGFSVKEKDGQYYAYSGKEIENSNIYKFNKAISLAYENICYNKDVFESQKHDKKLWLENKTK